MKRNQEQLEMIKHILASYKVQQVLSKLDNLRPIQQNEVARMVDYWTRRVEKFEKKLGKRR